MPPARPAKPRVGPFAPAELARMAWSPSYRAPRVREMHDPDLFADRPVSSADLSGRAFLSGHHDGSDAARLVAVQPFVAELARSPYLNGLRRLDLSGNRIGPAGVRELVGSAYLGRLEELVLSGNDLGPEGMAALRGAARYAGLRVLVVAENGLGAADLAELPPGLVALDVSGNRLGPWCPRGGASRTADGPLDPPYERFRASGCDLGSDALGLLAVARTVDLRHNRIGPGAAWPERLDHLRDLDLGFNDLADEAVGGLSRAAGLRSLGLAGNRLTPAGVAGLAFAEVESLDLSANPLGDAGVAAVLDGRFPALSRLALSDVELNGVGRLVRSPGVGRLRSLSLAWNRVGDVGAKALAGCADLAGLEELDLTGTGLGFAGAVALAESRHLRLQRLVVGENPRLPAEAARMLADRFGRLG